MDVDTTPYPERMFRWTLKDTMDTHGVTRYALQKESGLAMNSLRAMYEAVPTRIDFPVIEKIIKALSTLTGQSITAADVFVWESDTVRPASAGAKEEA